jgi:predicted hydrocarbon binding protein
MVSGAAASAQWEDTFWNNLSSLTDYFTPSISPIQKYLGVTSKELMYELGSILGARAAEQIRASTALEMLQKLEDVWVEHDIGTLQVVTTDPLVLMISDCRTCGQLPGTGHMFDCAFHEGFFHGALSSKLGKTVSFRQDTNYEGAAGTWCRILVSDTEL